MVTDSAGPGPKMADPDPASPDHSSSESFEGEDDSATQMPSGQWPAQGQASPSGTSSSPSQQTRPVLPMQKRRRVTRACDECRRKKIKCDGKQPCTHCTVYSYDCTYDQPSNRRRNPAPQYIEALENRLQRAEALLRTFIPNLDIKDPNFDSLINQRQAKAVQGSTKAELQAPNSPADGDRGESAQDGQLRSMIASTGQLDLDERGEWDFHGGSSGAVFLRRMREQFGGLLGPESRAPFLPRPPRYITSTFESQRSSESPYDAGLPNTLDLPPREIARKLCFLALNRGCALLRFVHEPTFYKMFDRIYDTPPEDFTDTDHRYLPLLYVVLALGEMFTEKSQDYVDAEQAGYKASIEQGVKYFKAGRQMLDVTECRDLISLQAILFLILFLQASSNLSTCYSYIGVALRCAVRMGMHRNVSGSFDLIEREVRRRVFWVIRKMDTYVSALLGFPRMLSEDDIDQVYPLEVDDECVTRDAILPMPAGKISLLAAANAHTRLMGTLSKVIKHVYPIKGVEQLTQSKSSPSYVISYAKIREIESDLKDWLDQLPMALRPGGDSPEEFVRIQQLLRMGYAHVQMMLYRPFLHYVSSKCSIGKCLNDRSYACAAACVSVSRNIIHITTEMKRQGVLLGAYWFSMYTTFFAILSLAFFVLENPDKPGSQEILAEATAGKNTLRDFAKISMGADRCNTALTVLFEKLPEKLKRSQTDPVLSKKKRSASSLNHIAANHAQNNLETASPRSVATNCQRAITFPYPLNPATSPGQDSSFDAPRYASGLGSDQKIMRSFHELVSPTNISATATPTSIESGSSMQAPFEVQQPYGEDSFIPELGAMMFPSADPFAYPNQPMIDFENRQLKQEFIGNMSEDSMPNMYLSNNAANVSSPYDNIEGQLFGPLPPYLMHNQSNIDMSQMNMTMPELNPQEMRSQTGLTPGVGVNFDEIFAEGNEEWNSMLTGQGYMQ